jgi:hypothetical protein
VSSRIVLAVVVLALAALGSGGCVRVRAHQRETLSKPALAQPALPTKHAGEQHVFEIREGTSGAAGGGGGGCGCN